MNLEEFRKSLESDATIENKKLKVEIEKLKKQLQRETSEHSQEKKALLDDCKALSNRCFVLTRGTMCVFCQVSGFRCEHALSFDEKVITAKKLMEDNNNAEN